MNFGELLKSIRIAKGFTQESLADKIGVKKQTISRYENSDREPNVRTAKRIADALGVSLAELALTDEMPDTPKSAGHREEEYEEFYRNVFSKLSQENIDFLIAQGQFLLDHQKSQDDQE